MKRYMSVVSFKFHCNDLIRGKIIKEMPGSVAIGTLCLYHNVTKIVNYVEKFCAKIPKYP